MTIVELGEMAYVEVSSHDIDIENVLDHLEMDDLWDIVNEDGSYVTVSYGVQVCTPDEDEYKDYETEVFIEKEAAVEKLQEEFDRLQAQKSNVWTQLREAEARITELERPTRYDISDITKGLMGQGI